MTRRELREHTFLLLFRREFHSKEEMEEQLSFYFDGIELSDEGEAEARYRMLPTPQGADAEKVKERYHAIVERMEEIDSILAPAITGWKLERVGTAEREILRQALYEMRFDEEVPEKVAINEAVELAKKFGAEMAPGFVNGVLAKLTAEKCQEAE